MTDKLKPCPFCGQEDVETPDGNVLCFYGEGGIICDNCGFEGPDGKGSKLKARDLWNTRADSGEQTVPVPPVDAWNFNMNEAPKEEHVSILLYLECENDSEYDDEKVVIQAFLGDYDNGKYEWLSIGSAEKINPQYIKAWKTLPAPPRAKGE